MLYLVENSREHFYHRDFYIHWKLFTDHTLLQPALRMLGIPVCLLFDGIVDQ